MEKVSFIQLKGEPYQRTIVDRFGAQVRVDTNTTLNNLAQNVRYKERLREDVEALNGHTQVLFDRDGYYSLDRRIKEGRELNFDEAFSLATFVCTALNRPLHDSIAARIQRLGPHETHLLQATGLLSSMSTKEAYVGLTGEEIAGVVGATIALDTVVRTSYPNPVLAFGGMGGDKGYLLRDEVAKPFSLSTLAAVGLAVDGPVHKHHSYPNTSKVAGQSAIEELGARSDFHSGEAHKGVMDKAGLLMSSCHDTRTLHTLSHLLRGETINHVIGPLAFTLSKDTPIQAFIGVNEKIHPETIVKALQVIHKKGFQTYDSSAVYCGTDIEGDIPQVMLDDVAYTKNLAVKDRVRLDEIAPPPYASLVAFLVKGENRGTYVLQPDDFFDEAQLGQFTLADLIVPNTADAILQANREVLKGKDLVRMKYLAMTMGLGLFTRHMADKEDALDSQTRRVNKQYLRSCTQQAYDILKSGAAFKQLQKYVEVTNQHSGELA